MAQCAARQASHSKSTNSTKVTFAPLATDKSLTVIAHHKIGQTRIGSRCRLVASEQWKSDDSD